MNHQTANHTLRKKQENYTTELREYANKLLEKTGCGEIPARRVHFDTIVEATEYNKKFIIVIKKFNKKQFTIWKKRSVFGLRSVTKNIERT